MAKEHDLHFYQGDHFAALINIQGCTRVVTRDGWPLAEQRSGHSAITTNITGCDQLNSVIIWNSPSSTASLNFSPYGSSPALGPTSPLIGFTGQRFDKHMQAYWLGNGYRAYSPLLRRFISPDSMSPFQAGGINAYAYCGADPINNSDPSGHMRTAKGKGQRVRLRSTSTSVSTSSARPKSPQALSPDTKKAFFDDNDIPLSPDAPTLQQPVQPLGTLQRLTISTNDYVATRDDINHLFSNHVQTQKILEYKSVMKRWLDAFYVSDLYTESAIEMVRLSPTLTYDQRMHAGTTVRDMLLIRASQQGNTP